MDRKRKILVSLVSLVAIAIVAVVTVVLLQAGHASTKESSVQPSNTMVGQTQTPAPEKTDDAPVKPSTDLPAFTQANATMLEKAMESRDKDEQAKALIPTLRTGSWKPSDILPDGATIKIERTSFKPGANGEATANATVSGSVQAKFVLSLVLTGGDTWLISTTTQQK